MPDDSNPTRSFTEKLQISMYDKRREMVYRKKIENKNEQVSRVIVDELHDEH